ncbi:hypothetical protein CYMTET_39380 [Cymbomonas tetramitiformis]|uniref:Uncharacterized protein n=1 Tax=Cymbomonas tetramitiformis TaxID=36881 RepID=A0AAE0CA75_9CHLO|nr:hypothetical protein CYMTET_39379 [Cymbomonas tetramitiformis]KAK3251279.1 hypothetical protein CYMTET_39380 [Cymbomonas tetramitiformis]
MGWGRRQKTLQALHKKLKDAHHPALQQVTTALETVEGKLAAKREGRDTENAEATTSSFAVDDDASKESDAKQYPQDIVKTDEILKNEQE